MTSARRCAGNSEGEFMSWKMEVCCQGEWSTNGCRYATKEEAEAAGTELLSRWYVPTASRAAESTDPVNWRFDFEAYKPEPIK